jgi:hypothetical protein
VEAGVEGADTDVRDWNPESSTPQLANTTGSVDKMTYTTCSVQKKGKKVPKIYLLSLKVYSTVAISSCSDYAIVWSELSIGGDF